MVEEVFASSKDKRSRKFIPQKLCTLIHSISFTPKRRRRQSRSIIEWEDSFSIFPLFRNFNFQSRFIFNFPLFPNCEERPLSMLTPPQIDQIGLISKISPPPPKSARSFQISKFSPSTNLPSSSQKTAADFCFSCNIWLLDLSRKHHHLLSTSPGDRWCVGAQK